MVRKSFFKLFSIVCIVALLITSTMAAAPGTNHGILVTVGGVQVGATVKVYRGPATNQEDYANPVATLQATTGQVTYLDQSGTAGTTYFYEATQVVNGIESTVSPEASATYPTVPASPSIQVAPQ